jgi:hypothetical protein
MDAETSIRKPVFFAIIEQCDDRAGVESLCTTLVAVLAAALHASPLYNTISIGADLEC